MHVVLLLLAVAAAMPRCVTIAAIGMLLTRLVMRELGQRCRR